MDENKMGKRIYISIISLVIIAKLIPIIFQFNVLIGNKIKIYEEVIRIGLLVLSFYLLGRDKRIGKLFFILLIIAINVAFFISHNLLIELPISGPLLSVLLYDAACIILVFSKSLDVFLSKGNCKLQKIHRG